MTDSDKLKDALILHFGAHHDFIEEEEVPYVISPSGISESLNLNLSECYECLSEFEKKGLIFKDERRVKRYKNKRDVYFLTKLGKRKEKKIREKIKDRTLQIKKDDDIKKISFDDLDEVTDENISPARVFLGLERGSRLDISSIEENKEVFVGRVEELNILKSSLKEVKKDGCRAVFIEGETGMGKTRLLSRLNKLAKKEGFKVLNGYCQRDISDPYFPFKKALSHLDSVEKMKDFFPSSHQEKEIEDRETFYAKRKTTFFETIRFLKTLSSQQPLLISLDDMQWADKGTLKLFHYMTDKLDESPVLLAATYRPGDVDPGHQLKDTFQRMARQHLHHKIELTPLDKNATKELIKLMLDPEDLPDELVDLIYEKTKGNPLFIKEIIREMIEENKIDSEKGIYPKNREEFAVPDVIEPVIRKRVKQLDDETRNILQLGSVIGEKIPLSLLQQCSKIDEMKLLDHLDILVDNDILRESEEQEKYEFEFDHSLIKKTIYEGLGEWVERKNIHEKVAESIESIYEGSSLEDWYPDLAYHHKKAENVFSSFRYYVEAAKRAENLYAHEDALDMYRAAFEQFSKLENKKGSEIFEIEDGKFKDGKINIFEIIERVSKLCNILGKYDKSRKYLSKALNKLDLIEEKQMLRDTDFHLKTQRMKFLRKIGETWLHQGEYEKALNASESGLEKKYTEEELDKSKEKILKQKREKSKLLSIEGRSHLRLGDYQRSLEIFREEKRTAEKLKSIKGLGRAYHDLGMIYLQKGDLEKAKRNFKEAINIWEELEEMRERSKSLNNLGVTYHLMGSFDKALESWEKGLDSLKRIGDKRSIAVLLNNMGELHHQKGELDKALNKYEESLTMCKKIGIRSPETMALINIGNIHKDRGQFKTAYERYQEALKISDETSEKLRKAEALDRIGDIYYLKGKFEEALERYEKCLDLRKNIGIKRDIGASLGRIGNIYREKGKTAEAIERYSKAIEISTNAGNRIETVKNLCGITLAYLDEGSREKAIQKKKRAQKIIEEKDISLLFPRVNLVSGLVCCDLKKFEEAETSFKESLEMSKDLGLKIDQTKTLFELGKLSQKKGKEKEGREYLEKASSLAADIGMVKLKNRCKKRLEKI